MIGSLAIDAVAERLRTSRGLAAKADIASVAASLGLSGDEMVAVGDDCAAIPDGDGYTLFAIEGFMNEFVAGDPWFAGWCGAMVNISDVAAMGGRPVALVDAIPKPESVILERWLETFPSFGYLAAVRPDRVEETLAAFRSRDIAAAAIGDISEGSVVEIRDGMQRETIWDFARAPLIGCAPAGHEPQRALA